MVQNLARSSISWLCPPQNGGPDLDNMKSSPTTAPTTPREGDQNLEFNMPNFPPGGENVSFCLLLITITQFKSLNPPPPYLLRNKLERVDKMWQICWDCWDFFALKIYFQSLCPCWQYYAPLVQHQPIVDRDEPSEIVTSKWNKFVFQNESEAILKIKESMQEEAKRFEKGSDGASDFFMP